MLGGVVTSCYSSGWKYLQGQVLASACLIVKSSIFLVSLRIENDLFVMKMITILQIRGNKWGWCWWQASIAGGY